MVNAWLDMTQKEIIRKYHIIADKIEDLTMLVSDRESDGLAVPNEFNFDFLKIMQDAKEAMRSLSESPANPR